MYISALVRNDANNYGITRLEDTITPLLENPYHIPLERLAIILNDWYDLDFPKAKWVRVIENEIAMERASNKFISIWEKYKGVGRNKGWRKNRPRTSNKKLECK